MRRLVLNKIVLTHEGHATKLQNVITKAFFYYPQCLEVALRYEDVQWYLTIM